MQKYHVKYKLYNTGEESSLDIVAKNKYEAYRSAIYNIIPTLYILDDNLSYRAWVESVTYKNGKRRDFNTFEGKPL